MQKNIIHNDLFIFEENMTIVKKKKEKIIVEKPMKPMFKWSGGKTREMTFIKSLLPTTINRVVEPFVGGGAFFFNLNKESIINDNDPEVVNFYQVVKNSELFPILLAQIEKTKLMGLDPKMSKKECRDTPGNLCNLYYESRNYLNSKNPEDDILKWAYSFIVVRQLCFSGMYRKHKGVFNVPFGWYGGFGTHLTTKHHDFLQNVKINSGSFSQCFTDDLTEDDFIFLDPPYLNRAGYNDTSGTVSTQLHTELFNCLNNTRAKWMIVHCDDPFYRDTYSGFNIIDKNYTYSQNFKGRIAKNSKVSHLYITNYTI